MTLRQGECQITEDSITIKKEVLEQWRDHYGNIVSNNEHIRATEILRQFYIGIRDVFVDLLKMFEPLEGE